MKGPLTLRRLYVLYRSRGYSRLAAWARARHDEQPGDATEAVARIRRQA